jgi:DNA-binding transcriptional LysR family regulator
MSKMESEPLSGRDLLAFVAAVETASVNGAGDALGLTQSAISKRIQALERRTGATLLQRTRLGVRPTEAGRALYPEAKQALAALERAARAIGAGEDGLRLAASHTIGEFLLPGWLATFRASEPVAIQMDVINSPGVIDEVRDGRAEIGFVEGIASLAGLDVLPLMRDELAVVVAAEHRWARRSTVDARALTREPYLTRERDSGTRAVAAAALARHGIELEPALETPSIQGLKRAVLSGGFTVISRLTVQAETAAGTLRALPVRGVDLGRELRAIRRHAEPLRGPAGRLWGWLQSLSQNRRPVRGPPAVDAGRRPRAQQ